jgi:hypothetical protein
MIRLDMHKTSLFFLLRARCSPMVIGPAAVTLFFALAIEFHLFFLCHDGSFVSSFFPFFVLHEL